MRNPIKGFIKTGRKPSLQEMYEGFSFADAALLIESQFPDRDIDSIDKETYNHEMLKLSKMNDHARRRRAELGRALERHYQSLELQGGGELPEPYDYTATGYANISTGFPTEVVDDQDTLDVGLDLTPLTNDKQFTPGQNLTPSDFTAQTTDPASITPRKSFLQRVGDYFKNDVYAPAAVGQAVNLGLNAAMLAGGYDRQQPYFNPYEQDILRNIQTQGQDFTALRNQAVAGFNTGMQSAGQARSAQVRSALQQNLSGNLGRQLSEIQMQERSYRDSVKQRLAEAQTQLGNQKAQALRVADELTARNKGRFQSELSQLGAQVSNIGEFATRLRANKKMNDLYVNILNSKYTDFKVRKDLYDKVISGDDLSEAEIIELKNNPNAKQLYGFANWMRQDGNQ